MRILVTGAAGFIGSHLCDELLRRGHEVTGMDNLRNGKLENLNEARSFGGFQFMEGDILDVSACQKAMENCEVVYHLACVGVRHSIHSPFENHRVNAEGSLNVLEAARKLGVRKFYYISTSEVYGKTVHFPIRETDPTMPLTVYGSSKLAGEHYTHSYNECYGMDSTVLRIFNNYGPRAHYEGDCGEILPRSIVRILYGENPVIFGDGSVTRDFFFVKDTAALLSDLAGKEGLSGLTINVGTGEEISMKHLLEKVLSLMPEGKIIDYLDARPADVPRLWVDNSVMKSILGERPLMSFEQGLNETIAFYRELMKTRELNTEITLLNWQK